MSNDNILINGDFESTSATDAEADGVTDKGSWFTADSIEGWEAEEGLIEIHNVQHRGVPSDPTVGGLTTGYILELDSAGHGDVDGDGTGADNNVEADATVVQDFTLTEAGNFDLSFSYSARTSVETSTFCVFVRDADGNVLFFQEFSGSNGNLEVEWQQYFQVLTLDAGTYTVGFSSTPYADSDGRGAVIDNVSITDGAAQEYLDNGSFDGTSASDADGVTEKRGWFTADAVDGWRAEEGLIEIQTRQFRGVPEDDSGVPAGFTSGRYLELDSHNHGDVDGDGSGASTKKEADSTVIQRFTVSDDSTYDLSFSYAARSRVSTSDFDVTVRDSNGIEVFSQAFTGDLGNLEVAWQRFSQELELSEGDYVLAFSSRTYQDKDTVGALIDNVSLVDVGPDNTPPVLADATFSIPEESEAGTVVGTLTASDVDGDTLTFTVAAGDTVGLFAIDATTGEISLTRAVDDSEVGIYTLTIAASDGRGGITTATATLEVTAVNDAPFDLTLSNLFLPENSSGAVVGDVGASDPDSGDTLTFSVDDPRFEIVGGALKLVAGASLDFESEPTVDVEVTATDSGGLSVTETFTLTVGDVNEAPTAIALDNLTVLENAAGAVVGAVTVSDPDAGDSFTFSVNDPRFEVVGGDLKLASGERLDFESEPTVDVAVTATDSAGLSVTESFTVTVGGVNEAPTAIALDNLTVLENAAGAVVGAVTVSDPDAGDSFTFSVDDARFEVVGGDLKLVAGASLDFESEPTVDVAVTATDSGGLLVSESFTVTVGDVNEAPTAIVLDNLTVLENADEAIIGSLTVSDPDAGDNFTFSVDDPRFEVVGGALKPVAGASLDFESEPTVDVAVTATDSGGLSVTESFTLTVSDVNEAPTAIAVDNLTVLENAAGAVVGAVTVSDPDAGESFTFSVDDPRFEVVGGDLKLVAGASLDFESDPTVDVEVTATDSGGLSVTESFTVTVGDVNEAPTAIVLDNLTVLENADEAIIGSLTVSDPDAGDNFTFSVDDPRFEVVGGALKLVAGASLDFENDPTVDVEVTATDSGGLSVTESFTLTVGDVNEAPTAIAVDTLTILENAAGAVVGAVTVSDPDAGESFTFSVDDARFEIVGGDLKLVAGASLDFESESTVDVEVTATDSGGLSVTESFTLTVGDVNEAPTAIAVDNLTVFENAAGAVVGAVTVSDPDAGESFTFSVDDARFEVVGGDLKLVAGASLDFESEPTVDVEVTATDSGGLSVTESFTLSVGDVNEGPTTIALDNSTVLENAAGAVVGAVTVSDPDAGDSFTFSVDDARFEVVGGDLKLVAGASLDFESEPTVDVEVTATDSGGLSVTESFTLSVGDVNEGPTTIALDNSTVLENAAGAVVGAVTVSDPDAGDSFTFSVDDARFEVVGGDLRLVAGASLDFESEPTVKVEVTATDSGGLSVTESFTVTVSDVNEAPTAIAVDTLTVLENAAGAVVGAVTVSDPDAGDSFTFSVDDARFEVVGGDLKLVAGASLDFESEPTVDVAVTATDSGGLLVSESFTVTVGDVNEAPTAIVLDNLTVLENADEAIIGSLTVSDPDAGDNFTFSVDDPRFEVVGGALKLVAGASLDFESEPTVDVAVTATDSGGLSVTESFTLTVGDVNEAPTAIAVDNLTVFENAAGAVVGAVTVSDPDAGESFTFSVDDPRFEVVGGDLKLVAGASLDFESEATVDVEVTATDSGGLSVTESFTVTVGDVNEAPTAIVLDNLTVLENADEAIIGSLTVSDPDAGESFTFSVDDPRFEVVGGDLKLVAGASLDFESEPTVDVEVTATDSGGLSVTESFTLTVGDVNEVPTAIAVDNLTVLENAAGAVVGAVTVSDPDAGDSFTFSVDDARFEVAGGALKLVAGASLDFESEPTVDVEVTATDSGGLSVTESFTLSVGDVNEGPTTIALDNSTVLENAAGAVVGAVTVSDPDAGESFTFSVDDPRFEVVGGDLKLVAGASLDFESDPTVDVEVTATDSGGLSVTESFTVTVGDVNEAPTAIVLDNLTVLENADEAIIGSLTVSDPDAGDNFTFSVDDPRFEVVGGALKLVAGASLDFENDPTVDVEVTATDSGGLSVTESFTLTVGDVNEAPTAIAVDNLTVLENVKDAVIGAVTVSDPDAGDSFTFSVNDPRFEIVGGDLKLAKGERLDFESEPTVDVEVTATDSGGLSVTESFTVTVGDVNEAPTAIAVDNLTVLENAAGAVVGAVTVSDPDAGESFSFSVDDPRFEVVGGDLKLVAGTSLDFESEPTVKVEVTATDSSGLSVTESFTVTVSDVNEAPTAIAVDNLTVLENVKDAVIGAVTVSDPDAGDSFTFSVDDPRFEIVGGDLKLAKGERLDFESEPTVDVEVTATDSGGLSVTESFTLTVGDVNEAPTAIAVDNLTVLENAAGAVVGAVTVSDPDAGESFTFSVDDPRFEVVGGDLKLVAGTSLDFESDPTVKVEVTATDSGGLSVTESFALTVGDVNEAPTAIAVDNLTVLENVKDAVIGAVTVSDPDAGDSFTFSVDDPRFEIVGGDLKLAKGERLDFESEPTVDVEVTATDSGGLSVTESFTLTVGDVNEAPTAIAVDNLTVLENAAGAVVGAVTVSDPDAGESFTFSVDDPRFEVVGGDLRLVAGTSLDFESDPTVKVEVTATDSGGLSVTESFALTVGDVNEAPTAIAVDNLTVLENAAGAVIGAVTVSDPDAGESFAFSLDDARFEVVGGDLKLVAGSSLDFESEPTVDVEVTATDSGGLSVTESFALTVEDVNEAPTAIALDNLTVLENAAGAVIGAVTVSDPDAGESFTFFVDDARFEVVGGDLKLVAGASLDFESEPTVDVAVTATDSGGLSVTESFALTVEEDVNEAPTDIALDNLTVLENAEGAVIGAVTVSDPDAGETFAFTVDDSRFKVNADGDLKLRGGESLDFETEPTVDVEVTATDSGGLSVTESFALTVEDVNDAPTDIALDNLTVPEDILGAVIGAVTVSDPDAGETFAFTVDDSRFKVNADGDLKLRGGDKLSAFREPTVDLDVTATDSGGLSVTESFTIEVEGIGIETFYEEDFSSQDAVERWEGFIEEMPQTGEMYLGRFNKFSTPVESTFEVPRFAEYIELDFRFYEIGTWEASGIEEDVPVLTVGNAVSSSSTLVDLGRFDGGQSAQSGSDQGIEWTREYVTSFNDYGGNVNVWDYSVQIPNTYFNTNYVEIGFDVSMTSGIDNESAGIDDMTLVAVHPDLG